MEPTDHNRRAFDDAHRTSENVLATPGMPERIRERLHGAKGSRVLHLFCGSGRESLDLTELGALVTGVDDDESAIEAARRRLPELPWVHADVHALPPELLLGRWDLVYLGYGSLARLRDVNAWAAGVAAALRSGGVLLLHDEHPAGCVPRRVRALARRLFRAARARRGRHRGRARGARATWARGVAGQGPEGAGPPRAGSREARRLETVPARREPAYGNLSQHLVDRRRRDPDVGGHCGSGGPRRQCDRRDPPDRRPAGPRHLDDLLVELGRIPAPRGVRRGRPCTSGRRSTAPGDRGRGGSRAPSRSRSTASSVR